MELAKEIVEQNAKSAKERQKEYYDQKAREINLQEGDNVLLLLPSSTKKSVATWQGPYPVTRKIGKVNYEIEMSDKGGRRQIFDVNLLKRRKEKPCQVNTDIEDGDGMEDYWYESGEEIQFGEHIPENRRKDFQEVSRCTQRHTWKDEQNNTSSLNNQVYTSSTEGLSHTTGLSRESCTRIGGNEKKWNNRRVRK